MFLAGRGHDVRDVCANRTRRSDRARQRGKSDLLDGERVAREVFARFNGSAPLPASTAEGPGEPVRHRYNPGGSRRINAILYRMAVTQLRCEPRAQRIYANARAGGHTKREGRRVLKRHLSDVIYRRMIRDLHAQLPNQSLLAA